MIRAPWSVRKQSCGAIHSVGQTRTCNWTGMPDASNNDDLKTMALVEACTGRLMTIKQFRAAKCSTAPCHGRVEWHNSD